MNGLTVFQIKVHNKYSGEDFDEDLRQELRRSGCKDEKICFILDELGNIDKEKSLARPILVSNWRDKNYRVNFLTGAPLKITSSKKNRVPNWSPLKITSSEREKNRVPNWSPLKITSSEIK